MRCARHGLTTGEGKETPLLAGFLDLFASVGPKATENFVADRHAGAVGRSRHVGFGNLAKEFDCAGFTAQIVEQGTGLRCLNLYRSSAGKDENSNNAVFHNKAPSLHWQTAL
jgi:hypothetical protein